MLVKVINYILKRFIIISFICYNENKKEVNFKIFSNFLNY